ncbi:MAG: type II secretion system protein [Planctomycetota bacterium]
MRRSIPFTARRGFTFVELTVVIAILLVLASIALAVGRSVLAGGQSQATADVMRVLDSVVFEYGQITNETIPSEIEIVGEGQERLVWPIADAANADLAPNDQPTPLEAVVPSGALMLQAVRELAPSAAELVNGIDPALMGTQSVGAGTGSVLLQNVVDGFGNPIRFVHPAWHGRYGTFYGGNPPAPSSSVPNRVFNPDSNAELAVNTLRRSYLPFNPTTGDGSDRVRRGDADEGLCQGDRPYLYSAGPDGDPGTITDNVYLDDAQPKFPWETTDDPNFAWDGSGRDLTR